MSYNFIKELQAKILVAEHDSAQSYASSGTRTVIWQTPSINTCSTYSAGVFTATVAGRFVITANLYKSSGSNIYLLVAKNGNTLTTCRQYAPAYNPTVSFLIQLAIGDTFSIQIYPLGTTSGYTGRLSVAVIP